MRRYQYQSYTEPIEIIPSTAEDIEKWAPFYDTPKPRAPWVRAVFTSGHADISWFIIPAALGGFIPGSALIPDPVRRKEIFHPSLYPAQNPYIFINTTEVYPYSIATTATVGRPTILSSSAPNSTELFIGGASFGWMTSTFNIERNLGAPDSATFDIDYTGGTMPEPGDEVIFYWQGTRRFGGVIATVSERQLEKKIFSHSVVTVTCAGYQTYTDRRIIARLYTLESTGVGGLALNIVTDIWRNYLRDDFGISFDYANTPDPAVIYNDQLFHYITVTEALNRIVEQAPGWSWWIDENKTLRFEATHGISANAPFSLANTNDNCDSIRVSKTSSTFRNRQWVIPSVDVIALLVDSFTGDGSTKLFSTRHPLMSKPIVRVNNVDQIVAGMSETAITPGFQWVYVEEGLQVFQKQSDTPVAVGVAIDILYPNPFPQGFSAEDAASIAAVGLYESVYHARNVTTEQTAESMAAGILERFGNAEYPETLEFEYDSVNQSEWVKPGQVISASRTFPTASGNYTIERVSSSEQDLTLWRHTVIARKGQGEVTDILEMEEIRAMSRLPIDLAFDYRTFELANDVEGVTNPGLETGIVKQRTTSPVEGVISHWEALFEFDPPEGSSIIVDILKNGVSIFDTDDSKRVVIPAGVDSLVVGYRFLTDNMTVAQGDIFSANVIQVGSTNPGSNGFVRLVVKPTQNPK